MAAAVGLAAYTGQAEIINFIDILLPHRRGGGGGGGSIDLAAVSGKFTEGLAKKLGVSFQLDERKIMILIGLGVLLLLCALAYPVVKIRREVAKAQAEEKTLSASLVELQQTQSEVLSLMADKEGLEKFTAFPDLVRRNKVHNSLVLLRLITATPAEVYLSSFEMHREGDHWRFTVDGTADTPDRPFEFIKRLTETGAFKDVNPRVLDSVVIDEEHAYAKFSLHGTVIPPVPPEPDATTGAGAETDEGPGSPGDATEPGS